MVVGVAGDPSDESTLDPAAALARSLERAHDLAARFHGCLVAVHCQDTGRPAESARDRGWFERWVEAHLGECRAAEVQVVHLVGPPVRALADHIERADLAVAQILSGPRVQRSLSNSRSDSEIGVSPSVGARRDGCGGLHGSE